MFQMHHLFSFLAKEKVDIILYYIIMKVNFSHAAEGWDFVVADWVGQLTLGDIKMAITQSTFQIQS